MKIGGLSTDLMVQTYLKREYGLTCTFEEDIPLFQKNGDPLVFVGGFKLFYAVVDEVTLAEVTARVQNIRKRHSEVLCDISVADVSAQGTLIHYLLDLTSVSCADDRFALYDKKTRNQVKKSYVSGVRIEVGSPPKGFYHLYEASMRRLKSLTKKREYFDMLEQHLGSRIVCFSLYQEEKLIGCNYGIVSDGYFLLCFNVSDSEYWHLHVNNRLYDEMIAWAIQRNIRFVDFGPSVRSDSTHNHFKEGFGAKRRVLMDAQNVRMTRRLANFVSEKKRNLRLRIAKLILT